jgi:hypothetical protein
MPDASDTIDFTALHVRATSHLELSKAVRACDLRA